MNTIQALYHGRLSTQPLCPECKEEVRHRTDDVTSLEKLLQNHLNEHGIVLFQQYIDAWNELLAVSNENSFIGGFRLGAQLTFDVYHNRGHSAKHAPTI